MADWKLTRLRVAYGQDAGSMREWGLFVSKGIKDPEPDAFGEPGIFLIRPDGTVYMAALNSMPAARPASTMSCRPSSSSSRSATRLAGSVSAPGLDLPSGWKRRHRRRLPMRARFWSGEPGLILRISARTVAAGG